jgi:ATP-dependent Clp protease ATP-binding subunit ClpB
MKRLQGWLKDKQIVLELTDAARNWIGEQGYDPSYGARPLKRVIQKHVQDELAREILAGNVSDGQKLTVDVKKGKIKLMAK